MRLRVKNVGMDGGLFYPRRINYVLFLLREKDEERVNGHEDGSGDEDDEDDEEGEDGEEGDEDEEGEDGEDGVDSEVLYRFVVHLCL